ncbi:MAG: esterase [Comamonadaceae bacterium]|nr:esterase [Comamonadaceae bacterium]
MSALICGSVAYDTVMVFEGRFKDHILADRIHLLNVSFLVPGMRRNFGGCAGNIAYNLKLLGGEGHAMAVVGSSLGGFYAMVLAERLGCPAVLLNPAVEPARDLAAYVGELRAYHDASVTLQWLPEALDELRALAPARITRPERCFAVIAKGDELLDWREMAAHCAGAQILLLEGSDHALSDFAQHLPAVLRFLRLGDREPVKT